MPEIRGLQLGRRRSIHIHDLAGLIAGWSVWLALTIGMVLFVREYSRNIPIWDEFGMVSVMTGSEPIGLRWAWAQHNEHRVVIPRLIMAGLFRTVANDFRVPRYTNVVFLSVTAATMLLLARRVRGSARLTDVLLPLSILNISQAESLMIGFAMNLILSSSLAIALIVVASRAHRWRSQMTASVFGLVMVLLPLTGGSGWVMLPPLALWLAIYVAGGWWSGQRPRVATRAIGLGMLLACAIIAGLYSYGYVRPPYHPLPSSAQDVTSSTLLCLSLAIYPHMSSYWWPAIPITLILLMATLVLLAIVSLRWPDERPRAVGLIAVILCIICVAGAVGFSRASLGPSAIHVSRYVTLMFPLLCAIYIAWIAYGNARVRVGVHIVLLALICVKLPDEIAYSRTYGANVRSVEQRVEYCLMARMANEKLMRRACPGLLADLEAVRVGFRMLQRARVGAFVNYDDGRIASTSEGKGALRR